ncbi:KH domain RNA binding protein YlqC [Helicobacter ailurogastricus]|uniref:KH domain RNA binding protein YlqC n=1 Tax=Helicobacter ailurogastricus TaxID=1578720 RepID=A0A0K2Y272_9HELI|nr:hypothetical protein ASB7_14030 [Helicobacter ailurogastricus]CRF52432.1 KH domain RNA binding protein YlqC [Helicobacter ailurogastricus]
MQEPNPQEGPLQESHKGEGVTGENSMGENPMGFPIENFVVEYCKKIVSYPQVLRVQVRLIEPGIKEVCICANPLDMGRVIGKDGKMVSAIKAFISGVKAKDGFGYKIVVVASENPYVL